MTRHADPGRSGRLPSLSHLERPPTFAARLRVRDVLEFPGFAGATVVAGDDGAERLVEHINVMQVPTDRFAKADELILAAADAFAGEAPSPLELISALAGRGVAAVAIRGAAVGDLLGQAALEEARRLALPLIELPARAHLNELQAEVLDAMVSAQTARAEAAAAVRDRLAMLVLTGGGLSMLPDAIAEVIGGQAGVVDADGTVLAASEGADPARIQAVGRRWLSERRDDPAEVDREWVAWPVMAGPRRLGCLVARTGGRYDAVRVAALQHGAMNSALQLLHRQEAVEADRGFRQGVVRDLLSGALDAGSAERRASAIGLDPGSPFEVLLVAATEGPDPGEEALRTALGEAVVTTHRRVRLAIVPRTGGRTEPDPAVVVAAMDGRFCVGVSRRHAALDRLPTAYDEARDALAVATTFRRGGRVRRHEDLGVLGLLADVPLADLRAFAGRTLGPLDDVPPRQREALVATLDALIATGLNVADAARRGGWHYNTVRSRVVRLTDLLGPFMEDGTTYDSVALSLRLSRELSEPSGPTGLPPADPAQP